MPALHPPTPTTGGGLPTTADTTGAERALQNEEHQQALIRMRRLVSIGLPIWLTFLAMDFLASRAWGGDFPAIATLRLLGAGVIFTLLMLVRAGAKTPLSPRLLKLAEVTTFTSLTLLVSLMCLSLGGPESPYAPGVATVLCARIVVANEPWKQGLASMALPTFSWPLTMAVAAAIDPTIGQRMGQVATATTALLHFAYIVTGSAFVVGAGHLFWSLRRQLFANRQLGRYRLKRRLAAGGMGEVWVAWHPGLKRDVAVKVLRAQKGDAVALARFEREVKATSELTHPNTIRIFDFGVTEDGVWFYVMELLNGLDLAALMKRLGRISPGRAVGLVEQAARALAEAHRRGIVHRDIKPHNIFSCAIGGEVDHVKVLDFGIASTQAPGAGEAHLTSSGMVPGTPKYMAPEVALGQPATPASDVYSLGATLYFLLTGRAPHEIENLTQLLMKQQSEVPAPPSRVRDEPLPVELEALVARALAIKPEERFADAAALADALTALPPMAKEAHPELPLDAVPVADDLATAPPVLDKTPYLLGPSERTPTR